MNRLSEADVGGSGRRRTTGKPPSPWPKRKAYAGFRRASAARARAGGRPRGGPVATAFPSTGWFGAPP